MYCGTCAGVFMPYGCIGVCGVIGPFRRSMKTPPPARMEGGALIDRLL
eukprot:CAMPEP_0175072362 /NCGR_PEP_ID=MMETSP0052_2-20121109/19860_1 /TAXON_ID=51329 ORGANISM="Polytomella parva, Strain SAG 63-3" /NCGR_SAMPLE_ID=MMETSP0052_2 /ASSEMBLY_ACC=CAM_ASM_000194 /LENGTH=47 /DNA_ID= /DNA_START= /DNA_END= /DNA_ORIENTATION=